MIQGIKNITDNRQVLIEDVVRDYDVILLLGQEYRFLNQQFANANSPDRVLGEGIVPGSPPVT